MNNSQNKAEKLYHELGGKLDLHNDSNDAKNILQLLDYFKGDVQVLEVLSQLHSNQNITTPIHERPISCIATALAANPEYHEVFKELCGIIPDGLVQYLGESQFESLNDLFSSYITISNELQITPLNPPISSRQVAMLLFFSGDVINGDNYLTRWDQIKTALGKSKDIPKMQRIALSLLNSSGDVRDNVRAFCFFAAFITDKELQESIQKLLEMIPERNILPVLKAQRISSWMNRLGIHFKLACGNMLAFIKAAKTRPGMLEFISPLFDKNIELVVALEKATGDKLSPIKMAIFTMLCSAIPHDDLEAMLEMQKNQSGDLNSFFATLLKTLLPPQVDPSTLAMPVDIKPVIDLVMKNEDLLNAVKKRHVEYLAGKAAAITAVTAGTPLPADLAQCIFMKITSSAKLFNLVNHAAHKSFDDILKQQEWHRVDPRPAQR